MKRKQTTDGARGPNTGTRPGARSKYRPSGKANEIAEVLRRKIVSGTLAPGARLPTRAELVKRHATSIVTVQRAVEGLARDGLVEARGKFGTVVSASPPHRTRYAIVFPGHPPHSRDSHDVPRFWLALATQAAAVAHETGRRIAVHYLTGDQVGSPAAAELVRQVRSHLLAGVLFGGPPSVYAGTPLIEEEPSLPRAAILPAPDARYPRIGVIRLAGEQLPDRAMAHLAGEGCRRVGVIANWGQSQESFVAAARRHRLELPARWVQFVSFLCPDAARNLMLLLMSRPGDRPDGLFLADDNLVEAAAAGLVEARVRVPRGLKVVAHCNFPAPSPGVLPFVRLGYDAREIVQTAIAALDRQRAGEPPGVSTIPAVFDRERTAGSA